MPAVSVVIPTWNGASLLPIALDSLRGQTFRDFEVVVVDNGSTDHTATLLRNEYPEVRVVALEKNRGFAAAVNAGIAATRGRYVALLNNDAEADAEWLAASVRELEALPQAGAIACRVLQRRDPSRIDSAGDAFGVLAWSIGHGEPDGPPFRAPRWVASACAAAALYRREALEAVGALDERYFAYLEDVDLGLRLQLAGWRTRYVPDAVARHEGSATANRMGDFKLEQILRNSVRLFVRCAPATRLVLFAPLLPLWILARGASEGRPRIAVRALAAALADLPHVLAARSEIWRERRVSRAAYAAALAPALGRPGTTSAVGSADRVSS